MELKTPPLFYTLLSMSNHYEAPIEVRELEKILCQFAHANGFDRAEVFDDLLRYIISFFTMKFSPLKPWRYNKEQTVVFWTMLTQWLLLMEKQTIRKEWYDAFGDLYMETIASTGRTKKLGQNFTPDSVCDLMSRITNVKTSGSGMISDPTCGSGCILLAAHAEHPTSYLVAEDIDRTCCMMTVCNFIIHGCHGEVIWHNSLEPESYFGGWLVNEHLNKCGLPSAREITKEESVLWNSWENRKQEMNKQKIVI